MLLISINDDRSKGLFPLPPVLLTITFHRTMTESIVTATMSLAIKEKADERKMKLQDSEMKACGAELPGGRIGSCFSFMSV